MHDRYKSEKIIRKQREKKAAVAIAAKRRQKQEQRKLDVQKYEKCCAVSIDKHKNM